MSIADTFGTEAEGERCIVCSKSVAGDKGYAHIKHDDEMVTLCCPLCLETFRRNPALYVAIRATQRMMHPAQP